MGYYPTMNQSKTTKTVKAVKAKTNDPKTLDKSLGDYLIKFIYATFADIEMGSDSKYNILQYQSYANLCKEKSVQYENVKNRFIINDEARQYLSYLLNKLVEEVSNIQIVDKEDISSICYKLDVENAESYGKFMFEVSQKYKNGLGISILNQTLVTATDPT